MNLTPSPMLCKDDLSKFLKWTKPEDILWSYKLDGVRCLAEVKDGKVTYYSRNGKQFPYVAARKVGRSAYKVRKDCRQRIEDKPVACCIADKK